jgi:hypothetical protein
MAAQPRRFGAGGVTLPLTYVLPLRSQRPPTDELTEYLQGLSKLCPVVVVDGSERSVFDEAHARWSGIVRHVAPDPALTCSNGKARGVLTGVGLVTTDLLVIGDDDVRHTAETLGRIAEQLETADLVVPQNYFDPTPWHARWDTGRTLVNRVTGGDFPGTLGARTEIVRDGYDGDVLFENLELMRTVTARGGAVLRMSDLFVRRLPPSTPHFVGQRVRQAYDEFARPFRLLVWLSVLPLVATRRHRLRAAGCLAAAVVVTAEVGRRRGDGRRYFHPVCSLYASLWAAERAVCVWLAIGTRLRGGVRYSDGRIRRAANPTSRLRSRCRPVAP